MNKTDKRKIVDQAREMKLDTSVISTRLSRGWSAKEALETPIVRRRIKTETK